MRAIETFNGLGNTVATMTSSTTNRFLQDVNAMRASARAFTKARTNTCVAMPRASPTSIANRVFNAPNVGRGYPAASAGFGGLGLVGDHLLCPEVDDVVIAVKSAVAQALRAKPVTARASALVGEANAFVNRYSGFGSAVLVGSESCQNAVNYGKQLIGRLDEKFGAGTSGVPFWDKLFGGTSAVPNVNVDPSGGTTGGLLDALGSVKTIAIAGAVIAGVVLVAPVVWRLVK